MKWWRSRPLYTKIFIGLILGIIIGFVAGEQVSFIMQPIGDIFLRMLQMLVAPVVFFTIVNGITKMEDTKTLASVGGRLFVYYALTSLLAVVVGAGLAMITQPGKGSTAFWTKMLRWTPRTSTSLTTSCPGSRPILSRH